MKFVELFEIGKHYIITYKNVGLLEEEVEIVEVGEDYIRVNIERFNDSLYICKLIIPIKEILSLEELN